MSLNIRPATLHDFGSVFLLLQQLWPDLILDHGLLQDVHAKGIVSDSQHYLVGEAEKRVVGFCSLTIKNNLWQAGNLGHLDELVVDEKFRGRGFGKKILDEISQFAKNSGCRRLELDSAYHRKEAHQFYLINGYENRACLFSRVLD